MLVKIEARILIFPGTDFHFPITSVPPGTFLGCGQSSEGIALRASAPLTQITRKKEHNTMRRNDRIKYTETNID